MTPRLSLCMIVKDEAATLARCLNTFRSAVDQMIVVDTGSTDATASLAAQAGARVVPRFQVEQLLETPALRRVHVALHVAQRHPWPARFEPPIIQSTGMNTSLPLLGPF